MSFSLQDARLDSGTGGNRLVGVDTLAGLLAVHVLDQRLHSGHARHAAHEQHLAELLFLNAGVSEAVLTGRLGALQQTLRETLQLRPVEGDLEMLRAGRVGRDERQIDLRLDLARQLNLGHLGSLSQPLQRQTVLGQIDALRLLERVHQVVQDELIEILSAQRGVAIGGLDLENSARNLENRNIKSSTTQVVNRNRLTVLLVHSKRKGCRGRLIDDTQHVQARNLAGVLRGLTLGVVEVGRHGDDGLGHVAA